MKSVRVYLHNETSQTLVLTGEEHSGSWLGGGAVPAIAPGTVAMTGTKTPPGIPLVPNPIGTEGRLHYRGEHDGSTTFMVHWDNPFFRAPQLTWDGLEISRPAFHTNADESSYSFWRAEGRAEAVVHFYLRDARTVMTDFRPQNDGFLFSNSGWADAPYTLPILEGTPFAFTVGNANTGLCGGMVYAALDYFYGEQRIPQVPMNPPNDDRLFLLLVARLFDSFDLRSVTLMVALMAAGHDDDQDIAELIGPLPNRAQVMAHEEWPMIMADIDAGRPSPLTLITVNDHLPTGLGECHQVLAYGYEAHGHTVTLFIYDPNNPLDPTIFMRFEDGDISRRIVVTHNVGITQDSGAQRPIYCFIRMNYNRDPVTIPTEKRLTTTELAHRRLTMRWAEPEHGEEVVESTGSREYDIWPDCGMQRLSFSVLRRSTTFGVDFTTQGFYDPVVDFAIGEPTDLDVTIALQSTTSYTWPGQVVWQPGAPVDGEISIGREETRDIHFTADGQMRDATHGGMRFFFRAEDGSFTVPVVVRCRERNEADTSAWTWIYGLDVEGWREDVPGLSEARRECFKRYLDAHRDGSMSVEDAAARIELTLPGRRANPLLDPDPDVIGVVEALQQQDPLVIATVPAAELQLQKKVDLITQVRKAVKIQADIDAGLGVEEGLDLASALQDIVSGSGIHGPG